MTRHKKPEPLPSLYCRCNGFLLGCFMSLIRFRFAHAEFPILRRRMVEFLEEAGVVVEIPRGQRTYNKIVDRLMTQLFKATKARSFELGDFTIIGAFCCIDAAMRLTGQLPSDELRDLTVECINGRGLDGTLLYERFLIDICLAREESPEVEVPIKAILSPALTLLDEMIKPLPVDDRNCFFAMPFGPPYSRYFASLYRPFAREMECEAFRMWGGLSGEAYVDLMLTVIQRCGTVVADLSGLNPNVIYEVGVARGLNKKVLLLCQRRDVDQIPANIGSDQLLLVYSPRERDWPKMTSLRLAGQASMIDVGLELMERRIAAAKRTPGQALPDIPSNPEELVALFTPPKKIS